MLHNTKQRKESGFTIIEVMIVLAIAAMILLVVLLAVPALQRSSRNTTIKNDASAVASGISEFTSNNDGTLPTFTGSSNQNSSGTLTLGSGSQATSSVKLQASDNVYGNVAVPSTVVAGSIYIETNNKCASPTGAALTATQRSTAIVYSIETSGSPIYKCLDS